MGAAGSDYTDGEGGYMSEDSVEPDDMTYEARLVFPFALL